MKLFYSQETKKAINNFGKSQLPYKVIKAYAEVKKACLLAIQEYQKRFNENIFCILIKVVDEIIAGLHSEQFPLPLKQGGAGTSINMNMNEVIAGLVNDYLNKEKINERIDPIEDVNLYQSTNDTFATVVTIIAYRELVDIEKAVIRLQEKLVECEKRFPNVLIIGRTELQDALPMTTAQLFSSWAGAVERDRWRLNKLKERIRHIALGGTAIGTCFFAPTQYIYLAEQHLRNITGLPLTRSQNLPDEISNLDKYSELANGIRIVAENLLKITGDFLLYTSSFINEIKHPHLQYASSIMPAKINPVILEFIQGIAVDVKYECLKISEYTQKGQLQLNAYLPFILNSLLISSENVQMAINVLIEKFLDKIELNKEKIEENLVKSNVILNSLIPVVGYNKLKELFYEVEKNKIDNVEKLKEILIERNILKKEEVDKYINPFYLTNSFKE